MLLGRCIDGRAFMADARGRHPLLAGMQKAYARIALAFFLARQALR